MARDLKMSLNCLFCRNLGHLPNSTWFYWIASKLCLSSVPIRPPFFPSWNDSEMTSSSTFPSWRSALILTVIIIPGHILARFQRGRNAINAYTGFTVITRSATVWLEDPYYIVQKLGKSARFNGHETHLASFTYSWGLFTVRLVFWLLKAQSWGTP